MKIKKLQGEELGRVKLRMKYAKEMNVVFSDDLMAYGDWLEKRLAALEENLTIHGVSSSLQHAGYLFNGRFYKTYDDLRGKTMNEENKPIPVYFSNDC